MEKLVKISWEEFLEFDALMKGPLMLFTEINRKEFESQFKLEAPRTVLGQEVGYISSDHESGYNVIVWSSALKKEKKLRDVGMDAGWVLIVKKGLPAYFAHPFHRTSGEFLMRMARYAWIALWKVRHLPNCPKCKLRMNIWRNAKTNQYAFICINKSEHERPKFLSWDYKLPPVASEFLEIRRHANREYQLKVGKIEKETGKQVIPKRFTRKPWKKVLKKT